MTSTKVNLALALLIGASAAHAMVDPVDPSPSARPAQLRFTGDTSGDYGYVPIGESSYRTYTVTNTGTTAATNLAGIVSGDGSYRFSGGSFPGIGGTCFNYLAPGDSCTIVVSFTPQTTQAYRGDLTVYYYDGQTSRRVSLQLRGRGTNPVPTPTPTPLPE